MANETVNATVNGLEMLEPYLDSATINFLESVDPLQISLGVLVGSVVLATIALVMLKLITRQVAKRTKMEVDDKLLQTAQQPVFRLIIIGGLYLAVLNLGLESALFDVILKFILTLAYLTVILFVVDVLNVLVNFGLKDLARKTHSDLDDEIIPIFHKAAVIVTWAFGLILILGAWGVDVAPFLAGLGIAGLAVSFALQTTLSNIIAGVALIMDKTFRVGDKVKLESGELGTIHEISLRSTRLRTYDNEVVIIPNDNLARSRIKNYTQPDLKLRVVVPFTVEYGTKPEKVVKLIEKTISKEMEGILDDPQVSVIFSEMADFSLNFQARFWVETYTNAFSKKLEANELIYNTLNKNKIGIPFPTRTIYMKED
ncbi:mechanosensitive ion channel [Candidatus Micrarchaeota archaeon]|nr:mechanosensitive ion channel [Candidatus Micrarchaeota archaeon]